MSSAQRQIIVTVFLFDIMQFDKMLKFFLIAAIAVARHYQQELLNLLPIGYLPAQRQQ